MRRARIADRPCTGAVIVSKEPIRAVLADLQATG